MGAASAPVAKGRALSERVAQLSPKENDRWSKLQRQHINTMSKKELFLLPGETNWVEITNVLLANCIINNDCTLHFYGMPGFLELFIKIFTAAGWTREVNGCMPYAWMEWLRLRGLQELTQSEIEGNHKASPCSRLETLQKLPLTPTTHSRALGCNLVHWVNWTCCVTLDYCSSYLPWLTTMIDKRVFIQPTLI